MYIDHPLKATRLIRVLELFPSRTSHEAVVIKLLELSLDDPKEFEALSYSWEGQPLDQNIFCEGESFLISATCRAALERLRLKRKSRMLWIDQICINQNSVAEKSSQVELMGDVYNKAKQVIVWLGVHPTGNKLVQFAKLHHIVGVLEKPLRHVFKENATVKVTPGWDMGELVFHGPKLRHKIGLIWEEMSGIILHDLYPISWFERVWTLQEVALARRVILLTARKSTDYDKFMFELNFWLYTKNSKHLFGNC
ncbi:heterokaryon incompatibility protein-domain-containing protein [Hyaloscypha sp. PMI_1271]|nr:heterokaryon incompatibility protein-domain-containing protein [Hyaloscypha sp. PMI_1271]